MSMTVHWASFNQHTQTEFGDNARLICSKVGFNPNYIAQIKPSCVYVELEKHFYDNCLKHINFIESSYDESSEESSIDLYDNCLEIYNNTNEIQSIIHRDLHLIFEYYKITRRFISYQAKYFTTPDYIDSEHFEEAYGCKPWYDIADDYDELYDEWYKRYGRYFINSQ